MRTLAFALVTIAVTACKQEGESPKALGASATPGGSNAPVASAGPAPPERDAWYAGKWSGTYETRSHRIDLSTKVGGLAEWAADDGKRGSGAGTLSLVAGADGTVTGVATGPLGNVDLRGAFDGDALAVRFAPKDADDGAFSGVLVARRDGDAIAGDLNASSPDGRSARSGTVKLHRGEP